MRRCLRVRLRLSPVIMLASTTTIRRRQETGEFSTRRIIIILTIYPAEVVMLKSKSAALKQPHQSLQGSNLLPWFIIRLKASIYAPFEATVWTLPLMFLLRLALSFVSEVNGPFDGGVSILRPFCCARGHWRVWSTIKVIFLCRRDSVPCSRRQRRLYTESRLNEGTTEVSLCGVHPQSDSNPQSHTQKQGLINSLEH